MIVNKHKTVRSHRNVGAKYRTVRNGSSDVIFIKMLQKIGFATFSL
jgi:hypothetical protein